MADRGGIAACPPARGQAPPGSLSSVTGLELDTGSAPTSGRLSAHAGTASGMPAIWNTIGTVTLADCGPPSMRTVCQRTTKMMVEWLTRS